jgi:Fe-Mn family superoxide dismutase
MLQLPSLPYAHNSLEPAISEEIMILHHQKHHQTYIDNANTILKEYNIIQEKTEKELIEFMNELPNEKKIFFSNNFGGHINHSLFWEILSPKKTFPSPKMIQLLTITFGAYEEFQKQFILSAMKHFGSGWTWLIINTEKSTLEIKNYTNQNTPSFEKNIPIIGLDLWEHSYYLQYKNKKKEYFESFFSIINWQKVEHLLNTNQFL